MELLTLITWVQAAGPVAGAQTAGAAGALPTTTHMHTFTFNLVSLTLCLPLTLT